MRIINFIYLGNINVPNGAAIFYKSLVDNKSKFNDEEHFCRFYHIYDEEHKPLSNKKTFKSNVRNIVFNMSKYSVIAAVIALYLSFIRNAKQVVAGILHIENTDITMFNDMFTAFYFCRKFPSANNLSIVMHHDGVPLKMLFNTLPRLCVFNKYIEKKIVWFLQRMDNIIFLSEDSVIRFNEALSKHNIKANRIVINNGVELPYVCKNRDGSNKIIGVSVGSICNRKGFDLLVQSLENIPTKDTKIQIYCIGDIADHAIVKQSKRLANINFVGAKNRVQIAHYLANADFFILCSRDEGMPFSIIEAMQYKLPIFATNVGAIPQMVSKQAGVLFNPSVNDISKILRDINDGQYNLEKMGAAAVDKYESTYSINKMICRYAELLKSRH